MTERYVTVLRESEEPLDALGIQLDVDHWLQVSGGDFVELFWQISLIDSPQQLAEQYRALDWETRNKTDEAVGMKTCVFLGHVKDSELPALFEKLLGYRNSLRDYVPRRMANLVLSPVGGVLISRDLLGGRTVQEMWDIMGDR